MVGAEGFEPTLATKSALLPQYCAIISAQRKEGFFLLQKIFSNKVATKNHGNKN